MSRRLITGALCGALITALAGPAAAQNKELDKDKVEAAIKKGVAFIKSKQNADGSFQGGYGAQYPVGPTAMATLTLIKAGHGRDPAVQKAFAYLEKTPLTMTYGTGLLLMALEARYAPTPEQLDKGKSPYTTVLRKRFRRALKVDKKLSLGAFNWLVKARNKPMWGYQGTQGGTVPGMPGGMPGGAVPMAGANHWDHSNTQYALLGLGAGQRLGGKIKPDDLFEVLDQILAGQAKTGPKVKSFFVPAADAPFKDMEKLAKDVAKTRAKERKGKRGLTVERVKEFYETFESHPMQARGWAYFPVGAQGKMTNNNHPGLQAPGFYNDNNSMTCAGLAITIIIKSFLERHPLYRKRYATKVDQSIRDGVAYLAHNWTLNDQGHPFYYLYGLERTGVLSGCHKFGEHDWYFEGGTKLLDIQKADGSWGRPNPMMPGMGLGNAQPSVLPQTCFAVLFLKRATVPLIPKIPERPTTSGVNPGGE